MIPGCTRTDVDGAGWCTKHVANGMNETEEAAFMVNVARIHAQSRAQVVGLCQQLGYGCVISEAARAWADLPWGNAVGGSPQARKCVMSWLRELATEIEGAK